MRTRIFGGLCLVSFFISSMAYLEGYGNVMETKDSASIAVDREVAESDQDKGVSLIAVTSGWCEPCKRLKAETLPVLAKEGYNVQFINFQKWDGPIVSMVPTLFYLDTSGNIIESLTEVGFRTPAQVKKRLKK